MYEVVVGFGFDDGNLSSTGAKKKKKTLSMAIDVKYTFHILTILHVVT